MESHQTKTKTPSPPTITSSRDGNTVSDVHAATSYFYVIVLAHPYPILTNVTETL